jgi:hypothetical protein
LRQTAVPACVFTTIDFANICHIRCASASQAFDATVADFAKYHPIHFRYMLRSNFSKESE